MAIMAHPTESSWAGVSKKIKKGEDSKQRQPESSQTDLKTKENQLSYLRPPAESKQAVEGQTVPRLQ